MEYKKHHHPKSRDGFTILEILVALGILAFGILAVASMQTASLSGTSKAQSGTDGTAVAMAQLEQLMALNYSDSNLTDGSHPSTPMTDATGRYNIEWFCDNDVPVPNTKTIQVVISWDEGGVTKSTDLTYVKMDVI